MRLENVEPQWSWHLFIDDMLDRAKKRIAKNCYIEVDKVDRLWNAAEELDEYFSGIEPTPYLDDVSTKNLLIHNGRISGIIDIDWIGVGDKLTYVAMTNMALLNMECNTDYVKYMLDEMRLSKVQKKAFMFYTLMYCVDFMGERGMQFVNKFVEVNDQIIGGLNRLYDSLWNEWENYCINALAREQGVEDDLFNNRPLCG